jgi:hypothetical protein
VFTGVWSLIDQVGYAAGFGLPIGTSGQPSHARLSAVTGTGSDALRAFVMLTGVRQLATGLIVLLFARQSKWTELATMLSITGVVVAGTDGVVLMKNGYGRAGARHAVPGVMISAMAIAVLWA